ncbi:response regulator transcription factor [Marivirga salinae]|uniref:Response regulator transcription factor n=1 Tax=Marivirga salinarum TaxID=3059078 RepID=A0AA49GB98_9BACT|nr:response regulator transcription factor [Marivirga sp. BDSF4-3]WKK74464.2 response regulator transcription factor [Marivirga sp. BDSF4-3]
MKKTINIIIVDDHHMFLEGISALLDNVDDFKIIETCENGKMVFPLIEKHPIDIIVTDINMPEMDGIELSKKIKDDYPDIKTLILSTHSEISMVQKCIKNGVDGYLLKNAEKEELITALKEIYKGEKYFSQSVKDDYMNSVFTSKKAKSSLIQLSRRELEVLKLITKEFTAQEIAEELFISQNTVNTHRKNLLSKLNAKNTAGLVMYAVQNGLINED